MQKDSQIALFFCGLAVGLLVVSLVVRDRQNNLAIVPIDQTVYIVDGIQIIDIAAKGGFTPAFIQAEAGVPTELRVSTNGTYDCSSTMIIPALGYQKTLSPTGTETIKISATQAQGTLKGTCGMGMYKFEIAFE